MRKDNNGITDEKLEEMLSALKSEKNTKINSDPRPPVINAYRLEKERLRREKRRLVTITFIASVISMTLMTICGIIITRIYSSQIQMYIKELENTEIYLYFKSLIFQYGMEIKVLIAITLLLFILSFVLSTVLLVKNKDKLLHSNPH